MSRLGELLEETRKKRGLPVLRAAEMLKTTPPTYRAWRRGQLPQIGFVPEIAVFTSRDEDEILRLLLEDARPKGGWVSPADTAHLISRQPEPLAAVA